MVPLSDETIASSFSSLFNVYVTTCGFMGMSLRVPRSSINWFHSFIRSWAFFRNLLFFCFRSGSKAWRITLESPTSPRSTWLAQTEARWVQFDLYALRLTRFG